VGITESLSDGLDTMGSPRPSTSMRRLFGVVGACWCPRRRPWCLYQGSHDRDRTGYPGGDFAQAQQADALVDHSQHDLGWSGVAVTGLLPVRHLQGIQPRQLHLSVVLGVAVSGVLVASGAPRRCMRAVAR
jgi:hypothetical protein